MSRTYRAQIADPELVRKAAAGEAHRIRPCLLCNQTCKGRDGRNPLVSCVVEPRAGHELDDPDPVGTAARPLDLVVIGGGITGLETARVAASRGHAVRVIEQRDELGGMVRTAAAGAGRARLALVADWLEAECRRLGVQLETGRAVDPGARRAEAGPDAEVIVATGSRPGTRAYATTRAATVVGADEVLAAVRAGDDAAGLPDGPIAIWDPIGGPIAVSVAELLAARGRTVTLITPDLIVGTLLSRSGDLAPANTRLAAAGVAFVKRAVLRSVEKHGAVVEDRFTGERTTVKAEALVDAGPRLPAEDASPNADDTDADGHVLRAGDAVAPRTIYEAILEGRRVALGVEGRS